MRRGIGVAYTQKNVAKQRQLQDLGDAIAAERVGSITNELDALTAQLQRIAAENKDRVREDPILRARLRQLADSLGADILASREYLFSKQSGLDDFYHALASEVVQVCIRESHYTGPYVPMRSVLAALRRLRGNSSSAAGGSSAATATSSSEITEDDVEAALGRLSVLGGEYTVVRLGGEAYINTVSASSTTSSSSSLDTVPADAEAILRAVGTVMDARRRQYDGSDERAEEHRRAIANYNFRIGGGLAMPSSSSSRAGPSSSSAPAAEPPRPSFSLADVRAALPPSLAQDAALRRVEAALQSLIVAGQVWVDIDPSHERTAGSIVGGMVEAAAPTPNAAAKYNSSSTSSAPSPSASASAGGAFFSSGGTLTMTAGHGAGRIALRPAAEANSDDAVMVSSPGGTGMGVAKEPTSADVLEHPAVRYWFIAFI